MSKNLLFRHSRNFLPVIYLFGLLNLAGVSRVVAVETEKPLPEIERTLEKGNSLLANPIAGDDNFIVDEDSTNNPLDVLDNDSDPDGDNLSISDVGLPDNGGMAVNGGTVITYTPTAQFFGTEVFTYTVTDNVGGFDTATVTVTVTSVNDPPLASDDSYTVAEDSTNNPLDVLTGDTDIDGGALSVSAVGVPDKGGTVVNGTTVVTYTPAGDFFGTEVFTYTVSDGLGGFDTATVTVTVTSANDAPVADDDTYTVSEDSTNNPLDVLTGDTDIEGDTLNVSALGVPDQGGTVINGTTVVTYTPAGDFFGMEVFTYTVTDGNGGFDTGTVTVTVTNVNDPPVADDDSYVVAEDSINNSLDVLTGDSDIDGDALSVSAVGVPDHGGTVVNGTSVVTYTPLGDFFGTEVFTYTVADGNGGFDTATVTVTVTSINDPPVADDDTYSVLEDSTNNPLDVLTGDTDIEGDTLAVSALGVPDQGGTVVNGLTVVSYSPAGDFFGTEVFTYTITDGNGGFDTGTVTVTVTNVNDPPVAGDDGFTVSEDSTNNPLDVLTGDTDIEGDTLTVSALGVPDQGGTVINGTTVVTYTPAGDFFGTEVFTYTVSDGLGGFDTATVTVTVTNVNDPPVAVDNSYTTSEDTPLIRSQPGVLGNDNDLDGDTLSVVSNTLPFTGVLDIKPSGAFTYTPSSEFSGLVTFTYTVSDSQLTDTALVSITVNAVNDAPVAANDVYAPTEDTLFTLPAPGVLGNDTDVEGDPLTAMTTTNTISGTLGFNTNGSFTYNPNPDYCGTDNFTYQANDGQSNSNSATVTLNVTCVNDAAPVANDDNVTLDEDTTTVINVIANDTDVDGNLDPSSTTTACRGCKDVNHGILINNLDGTFTYTPNPEYSGSDNFSYQVCDSEPLCSNKARVVITVTAINDPPVAVGDSFTVSEDSSGNSLDVLANDTDLDMDSLSVQQVGIPDQGGTVVNGTSVVSYSPAVEFFGMEVFTYTVTDGNGGFDSGTVTVTVTSVNDAPVADDDTYTVFEDSTNNPLDVLTGDTDIEGDTLTVGALGVPDQGGTVVNGVTVVTYTPAGDFFGTEVFTYTVTDGNGGFDTGTVSVTVTNVNDPPVAVSDSFTVTENSTGNSLDVLANDTDLDMDSLLVQQVGVPNQGGTVVNGTTVVTYTPAAEYNGTEQFTYQVCDQGNLCDSATVMITVVEVNNSPVGVGDAYSTPEDSTLNVTAPGVLVNDSDVDNDPLSAILVTTTLTGTLILNTDGSFLYSPNANFCGADSFTYVANDGLLDSGVTTVTITVNCLNDPPVANIDLKFTLEDVPLNVNVAANDFDVDGNLDPTSVVTTTVPSNGSVVNNGDGTIKYTPNPNFNGIDSFIYQICDTVGLCDTASVIINVSTQNDFPVASDDNYNVDEETTLNVSAPGVLGNDSDPDGTPIVTILDSPPMSGTLSLPFPLDGSFSYHPNVNFCGTDSFTYHANDGGLDSNIATVTIDVNCINDVPLAQNDNYVTDEDTPLSISPPGVQVNDNDVDGDVLTATLDTDVMSGTLTLNADGSFDYDPNNDFCGMDSFTYHVNDGLVDSNVVTAAFTVNCQNDAPVAVDDDYTIIEDKTLVVPLPGVLDNDSDVEGDSLSIISNTLPITGLLAINASGDFSYTPPPGYTGLVTFTYTITDGLLSDMAVVTITVEPLKRIYLPLVMDLRPIIIGDFETGVGDWSLVNNGLPAGLISSNPTGDKDIPIGKFSALLGKTDYPCKSDGTPIGYAEAKKTFKVPNVSGSVPPGLSFKYVVYTLDTMVGDDGKIFDRFEVYINAESSPKFVDGNTINANLSCSDWRRVPGPENPRGGKTTGWAVGYIDLDKYRGQTITVSFRNYNRQDGWYNTYTYLDDVQVVFTGGSGAPMDASIPAPARSQPVLPNRGASEGPSKH